MTVPNGNQDDQQRPAYEQARDELTELVRRLEAGGLTLEQSLQLWERGEQLAAICEDWLEGARARMASVMARRDQDSTDPGDDPWSHGGAGQGGDSRTPGKPEPSAPF